MLSLNHALRKPSATSKSTQLKKELPVNFSVKKLNDASVLVLMECVTPHFQGMMLYPLPFLGENYDDDIGKLVAAHPSKKETNPRVVISDYHVIFNLTPYSEAVAEAFITDEKSTVLILSCNEAVQKYMVKNIQTPRYDLIPAPESVHAIFDTVDPLRLAKFATIVRKSV